MKYILCSTWHNIFISYLFKIRTFLFSYRLSWEIQIEDIYNSPLQYLVSSHIHTLHAHTSWSFVAPLLLPSPVLGHNKSIYYNWWSFLSHCDINENLSIWKWPFCSSFSSNAPNRCPLLRQPYELLTLSPPVRPKFNYKQITSTLSLGLLQPANFQSCKLWEINNCQTRRHME